MKEQTVRVSISEASRLFGVSEKSIRRALNQMKSDISLCEIDTKFHSLPW